MRFVQTPQTHFCLLFLKSMNGLGLETPQEPELHANSLILRSMHFEEREDINVGYEFGSWLNLPLDHYPGQSKCQGGPWFEAFCESSVIDQGGWIGEKGEKHWDVRLTVLSKTDTEAIIEPLEELRT